MYNKLHQSLKADGFGHSDQRFLKSADLNDQKGVKSLPVAKVEGAAPVK
jgi:hypothetical protein